MSTYNFRKRPILYSHLGSSVKKMRLSKPFNKLSQHTSRLISGISKLPVEILVKIFEQLDVSTKMAVELVCRRWNRISVTHSWSKTSKLVMSQLLPSFVREPQIRILDYKRHCRKYMKQKGYRKLSALIDRCVNFIREVDLSNLENYINFVDCWNFVLARIPVGQLEHVNLSGIEISTCELQQLYNRFADLKSAILKECFGAHTPLDQFLSVCTSLETLDLSENNMESSTFQQLPSSLKCLSLNSCRANTDFLLTQIPLRCPELECLQVCDTEQKGNTSERTLNALFQLKRLHKLVLKGDFCAQLNKSFQLEQLTYLEVTFDNFLSNTFLQSVGQCSQLKTLFLFDTAPDQEVYYAKSELLQLANLKQLNSLSLVGFWNLSDTALKAIVKSNPKLEKLDVSFSLLTDDSMLFVIDNCKQLQSLVAANCEKIGMKTIDKLINHLDDIHGEKLPQDEKQQFQLCCCNTAVHETILPKISNPWLNVQHYKPMESPCMFCYFFSL